MLALSGALALCLSAPAQAAPTTFDLAAGTGSCMAAGDCSWLGPVLQINGGADISITGNVNDGRRIVVAAGAVASITLNGVSITNPGDTHSPLYIDDNTVVTLNLTGANTLTAGTCGAGIAASSAINQLNIHGPGSLTVTGGNQVSGVGGCFAGAGIGGSGNQDSGPIFIYGGTITAHGGKADVAGGGLSGAAGIGGANNAVGDIWIGNESGGGTSDASPGAVVTAIGGERAAGIGGGSGGTVSGNILLTAGATVTATGGAAAAGSNGGGGAGVGSGGTTVGAPFASGFIMIGHYATVSATGGKGDGTGGDGANIGQGGFNTGVAGAGNGAGLTSLAGPADKSVTEGADASFTCTPTFPAGPAAPTLDWAWDNETAPGNFTNVGNTASLTLNAVTAAMNGNQYFCKVGITKLANDPAGANSTIVYASHLAKLSVAAIGAPVITRAAGALPGGTEGKDYSLTLAATNNPLNWAVTTGALPPGLALDAATGKISGTLAAGTAGNSYTFGITASNAAGPSLEVTYTITVGAPGAPGGNAATVPTLGEFGLAALGLSLLGAGGLRLRRKG